MGASFDRYQSSYSNEVDRAIAFARTDSVFFAELKAADLVALAGRRFAASDIDVLDFGCGIGTLDALLASHFGAVTGVDVSSGLIDVAEKANPGVEYQHYDGGTIPYPDDTFDLAFASCVFHHIEPRERAAAAAELARLLRRGGVVAVYEHNPLNPLTRLAVSRCEFDEGVELLSPTDARALLRQAGLHLVESRYIAFLPWRGRLLRALERLLAHLPLGAQYVVVATKGEPAA